jgi:1-acyl-sn-glycerol-3-phosphate acyltransferase
MSLLNFTARPSVGTFVQAHLPQLSSLTWHRLKPSETKPPLHGSTSTVSRLVYWMLDLAYFLGRWVILPIYFSQVKVFGQENLPAKGAVILAPTHRSRWDALLVPYAAGYQTTGRHLRFMVTADEVVGLQGWFIQRMGGFAVDTKRPAIASLRHGVELLEAGEPVVIFPEGDIYREKLPQPIKPGLARLALQANSLRTELNIQIVPIAIDYSDVMVPWGCRATIQIGKPLPVVSCPQVSMKHSAKLLTEKLQQAMKFLAEQADKENAR